MFTIWNVEKYSNEYIVNLLLEVGLEVDKMSKLYPYTFIRTCERPYRDCVVCVGLCGTDGDHKKRNANSQKKTFSKRFFNVYENARS